MRTEHQILAEIGHLTARRQRLIAYMQDKAATEDWHGVQDAGSDLRDIDERAQALRWVLDEGT